MSDSVLDAVVASYVDDLTDALVQATDGLGGLDRSGFRDDVTTEAFNLTAAMVDADDRHTDDELNALIDVFGPRMRDSSLLMATPRDVRGSTLITGAKRWLESDSELFAILLAADVKHDSTLADRYYEHTMDVAHVVASLDVLPSGEELRAIAALRTRLLAGLRGRRDDGRSLRPSSTHTPASGDGAGTASSGNADPDATDAELDSPEADPPARPMEELLAELDDMVGLEAVKDRVHLVADFLRVQQLRADRGLPTVDTSNHLVFTGNPGTGKTTVARLLAQIFRSLGVVQRGHLVEVDRSALVAGFVGQTAPKVTEAFDRAEQGMLFIDEAYTLARGGPNDFGLEAIDQIVKLMEDRRERVVLVVAGYLAEMEDFLSTNPGMRSRFPTVIEFPDYSTDELVAIVASIGDKQRYHLPPETEECLGALLDRVPRTKGFGNARLARNIYEAAVNRHAARVVAIDSPTEEQLSTLEREDIPESVEAIDEPPRRRSLPASHMGPAGGAEPDESTASAGDAGQSGNLQ